MDGDDGMMARMIVPGAAAPGELPGELCVVHVRLLLYTTEGNQRLSL